MITEAPRLTKSPELVGEILTAIAEKNLLAFGLGLRSRSREVLPTISCDTAYPEVEFSRRSRNWWAWLKGTAPECVHLDREAPWVATLIPDALYVCGKRSQTRDESRPEVTLCRECLIETVEDELAAYRGRVVAFEPDSESFTQYFFIGTPDFERAGLKTEVGRAIERRLASNHRECSVCAKPATWLWFSRQEIESLDDVDRICEAGGEPLCSLHGAAKLRDAFKKISEANIFYMNLPYGEAGAYVWI